MSAPDDLVDEDRSEPVSLPSAVLCALLFAASLATGAVVLDRVMPPYLDTGPLRSKLEHFAAHADRYDTLFIGSSHVYRQVVPEVFDAATAAAGLPTSTFNFGIPGMQGLETEFVLERVLALRPARLRWVWIEPGDPGRRSALVNRKSERFIAWHDAPTTGQALDLWLGGKRPGYDWGSWASEHLPALARRWLQLGRGAARLRSEPPTPAEHLGPGLDGFLALDASDAGAIRRRRTEFLEDLGAFHEKRSAMASQVEGFDRELEPFEHRFLRRLSESVEHAGAHSIFLVCPVMRADGEYLVRAAADGVIPVAFNYADPLSHPDFYRVELRYDRGHLNHEGARLFSDQLARDFVSYARELRGDRLRLARTGPDQNWK